MMAATTTTMITIPAISAVEITGFVTVTVDTAVVVTVLVTVLVTVEVTVDVVTAVVVTVEVVAVVVVVVVVVDVVVVVVTGVHGMWKYDVTHYWTEGSWFSRPMNAANCGYLIHSEPLAIAWANGGTSPGGAQALKI